MADGGRRISPSAKRNLMESAKRCTDAVVQTANKERELIRPQTDVGLHAQLMNCWLARFPTLND